MEQLKKDLIRRRLSIYCLDGILQTIYICKNPNISRWNWGVNIVRIRYFIILKDNKCSVVPFYTACQWKRSSSKIIITKIRESEPIVVIWCSERQNKHGVKALFFWSRKGHEIQPYRTSATLRMPSELSLAANIKEDTRPFMPAGGQGMHCW